MRACEFACTGNMHTLMTISGAARDKTHVARMRRCALVIIVASLLGVFSAGVSAETRSLTTAVAGTSTPVVPTALANATLTTVIVGGSTVYAPPRLFAAYRDQLGHPISRDGARAILTSLADLYVRRRLREARIPLDDTLTGRGVLRVQVYEAQMTNVVFEGDSGRFRDALERDRRAPREHAAAAQGRRATGVARHAPDRGPRGHGDHAPRSRHAQCVRARGEDGLLAGRRRGAHEQSRHRSSRARPSCSARSSPTDCSGAEKKSA